MARLLVATFALSLLAVPFALTAGCGAKVSPGDGGDAGTCGPDDCGPNGMGAPMPCADGSMPSADYCGRNADGTCSWHGGECPAQKPCHSSSECAATEYCGSTVRSCLGSGVCMRKPDVCDLSLAPVCGCDGKTYSNACIAGVSGVVVASDGACGTTSSCTTLGSGECGSGKYCSFPTGTCPTEMPPPVVGTCAPIAEGCGKNLDPQCGCNGVTYPNPCVAAAAGMSLLHVGACETPSTVCGSGRPACAPGSYCRYPDGICGAPDWTGTCTAKGTGGCPSLYDPVCGCDRTTYSNSCIAAAAGVSVMFRGTCDAPPPPSGKSCGGIAGIACSSTEWCDYGSTSCGRDDSMGTCKPRPSACDGVLSPVCGCDGKIYDNVCLAEKAGVGPGTGCK